MSRNMRWMLVIIALLVLMFIIFVPLAFMFGRNIGVDSVVPPTTEPTRAEVVVFPSETTMATDVVPVMTSTLLPSSTPLPSATPLPTLTPLPTQTPLPSSTPLPTNTPAPSLTPTPTTPCNWAQFVADLSAPDGTVLAPGQSFTKTWRLKNIGTCTWTTEYSLNFVSGTAMTTNQTVVYLKKLVKPGETVDVEVKMTAPTKPGEYQGNWLMKNPGGLIFGVGTKADTPVHVKVLVLNVSADAVYDFALHICDATWHNSTGDRLPCPTSPTGTRGFATVLGAPNLEERLENEPAIWVHPDHVADGRIRGKYPAYTVKNGDHFKAWIGCLKGMDGCSVRFELRYKEGDAPAVQLGSWTEKYDGSSQVIDIDLSSLADKSVTFILTVYIENTNYDKANAYWFVPRIVNQAP